jgi:WD40 repeat protein
VGSQGGESADLDGEIRTWNYEGATGEISRLTFRSPINFIGSASNGEKIITRHDDNELLLWDKNFASQPLNGYNGYIRTVVFSGDGKYLATAGSDSSLIIWNIDISPVSRIKEIKTVSPVKAMAFCRKDTLVYATVEGAINLWDITNDGNTIIYNPGGEKPLCLVWNDSRKTIISGCSNGSLLLFNLSTGKPFQPVSLVVHSSGIDQIAFNPDYSLMATSSWDKTIKLYYYHDFFELGNSIGGAEHLTSLNQRTRSLCITSDNKLVAGLADKSIHIWETSSEKLASMICNLVKREMTLSEWNEMVGPGIPYENTCNRNRKP